jgi:hypothetical protein
VGRDFSGFGSMTPVRSLESRVANPGVLVDEPGTKPRDEGREPRVP